MEFVFDEYLPENPKLVPPTFGLVTHNSIFEKYEYDRREDIENKKKENKEKAHFQNLLDRCTALSLKGNMFPTVQEWLSEFKKTGNVRQLEEKIVEAEKSRNNPVRTV